MCITSDLPDVSEVNRARVEALCLALESGEYPQASGALRKLAMVGTATVGDTELVAPEVMGYCCLGVGCLVAEKAVPNIMAPQRGAVGIIDPWRKGTLPEEVREWFGFDSSDPVLLVLASDCPEKYRYQVDGLNGTEWTPDQGEAPATRVEASSANDTWHLDFPTIAAAFRRTYLTPIEPDAEEAGPQAA